MTFEEWWIKTEAYQDIPKGSNLWTLVKKATRDAWYEAYEEGCADMIRHIAIKQQEAREENRERSGDTE